MTPRQRYELIIDCVVFVVAGSVVYFLLVVLGK